MSIYKKLQKIQSELKVPKKQLSKAKNGEIRYVYRSCEDILSAVSPLLKENECCLTLSDEIENVGDYHYVKSTATLSAVQDGSAISTIAFAREDLKMTLMSNAQVTGATSSYARKYALNGLFAIDDTSDVDSDEFQKKQDQGRKEQKYICGECGKPFENILKDGKEYTAEHIYTIAKKNNADGIARHSICMKLL